MTSAPDTAWLDANFQYMMGAIGRVRRDLVALAGKAQGIAPDDGDAARERAELDALRAAMSRPPAIDQLCSAFGLSDFERYVLMVCAAIETDPTFPSLCAVAQGGDQYFHPTLNLAMALYPGEITWHTFLPTAPLRYWGMVEIGQGETLNTGPLRIDERTLHHLAGESYLDVRLRGVARPAPAADELPPSHRRIADRVRQLWSHPSGERPLIQLSGNDFSSILSIASHACSEVDLSLYIARASDIPAAAADREQIARLWNREALMSRSALLLDCDDAEPAHLLRGVVPFLDSLVVPVVIAGRDAIPGMRQPVIRLDVHKPSSAEQRMLWTSFLGDAATRANGEVESIVAHFNLGVNGLKAAGAQARERVQLGELTGEAGDARALWDACRAQARPRLESLARRIEPAAGWEDLVLPEDQMKVLREIAAHMRQRAKVYEHWGFAGKSARGLGISAMFAGPSGTGKTMAAEVLAGELMLDLYHIDLSQVVSKYIGETEKNLARVFDAAEEGGAILLFDEADALFGKRSDVKDSHDRYANVEVSYLLQRMEAYRGLAILTTNMKQAMDTAFLRRLRFVVQFPFPDAVQRTEIWRRAFPKQTPTDGLDPEKLGRLSISGGNIRNIALNAAFLAAEQGSSVSMAHLLDAARSEYTKLEKSLGTHETEDWL